MKAMTRMGADSQQKIKLDLLCKVDSEYELN